jgi:asparagine synthase (glutamine-hydrolysing)
MCGIAGYQAAEGTNLPQGILDKFIPALAHRGPDGTGGHVGEGFGLAHTRLAVIDLKTGDQPFSGPSETVLAANGEIYNYLELRAEYSGVPFATHSDCEVPLFAYQRDGKSFSQRLRGMYAIALADASTGALYLARDPFGIKPLYYAQTQRGMVFASTPNAIIASGEARPNISATVATQLLQLQFTTGRQTIFDDIQRVLPGETLEVKNGRVNESGKLNALPSGPPSDISEEEALKLLDGALMDSVEVHQRSDVPYGMFLSGGIDSSALLACMARLNERPVRAFTAAFPGTAVADEREHARHVAKAVGAEHIEISVTEKEFWNQLPAIVAAMDDPVADYAIVPTFLLAREAAKELKVVLCGEGGDELFAGYGRYRRALRSPLLGGRKMYSRGALDGLGVLRDQSRNWRNEIEKAEQAAAAQKWSRLQAAQAVDVAEWLPNDLLVKLDRCLMAHGVEGRTPFLDPVVADLVFRLPDNLKVRNGTGKYLLRRWLQDALPEAKPFSKKRGFTVPVGDWIASHATALAPLMERSPAIMEVCHANEVGRLFRSLNESSAKSVGRACWHLLFYALWHRIHVEGVKPIGDTASVLADKS